MWDETDTMDRPTLMSLLVKLSGLLGQYSSKRFSEFEEFIEAESIFELRIETAKRNHLRFRDLIYLKQAERDRERLDLLRKDYETRRAALDMSYLLIEKIKKDTQRLLDSTE